MATVIPIRPFQNALHQAQRAGHPEWRPHCITSVLRDLNRGRSGNEVAGQLYTLRRQIQGPVIPPRGSAA